MWAIGLALTSACGRGGEAGRERAEAAAPGQPAVSPVDSATAGMIGGRVVFTGPAPREERIDLSEEPACAAKHTGPVMTEHAVVNRNGTLGNVFVYVRSGLESLAFPVPSQPVTIDQDGCVYRPHVFGVQVGQTLRIVNSDPLLHNIKATPAVNRGFNISQPAQGMESTRSFSVSEVMVALECNVHGWMNAYVGVLPHPYFAVTGSEGTFTLANLPPGQYVIEAWHERFGRQTQTVAIGPRESAQVVFTFRSS